MGKHLALRNALLYCINCQSLIQWCQEQRTPCHMALPAANFLWTILVMTERAKQIIQVFDYNSRLSQQSETVPGHGLLIFQRAVALFLHGVREQKKDRMDDSRRGGGSGRGAGE